MGVKIILDTNLWISFLISKRHTIIDELLFNREFILIFSKELVGEFVSVAQRPKFQKYFTVEDIINLLQLFDVYGEFCRVSSNLDICRDSKDNFLLNLAIDSSSDFLITGDSDLLTLTKVGRTEILTWTDFVMKLKHLQGNKF
ncbi:MAG: putative toxin-antitoxin system toxin component, PIN family [Bacteroidales bacterium]